MLCWLWAAAYFLLLAPRLAYYHPPFPPLLALQVAIDLQALFKGLRYLAGICLVLAYAWICDRSGDSLGLHRRNKRCGGAWLKSLDSASLSAIVWLKT
jgi:hypothetical protein